jgi:phage-related protein
VVNKFDIAQTVETIGEFPIVFNCKPFKKSTFKDNFIITKNPYIICNPGTFESSPRLDIYGTGNISITVNSNAFSITGLSDHITVDSELMDCHKDNELKNNQMTGDFPVFQPGDNIISWSGDISKIEVTPNWRWI